MKYKPFILLVIILLMPSLSAAQVDNASYIVQFENASSPVLVESGDISRLERRDGIRFIEKNAKYQAALTPNDTFLSRQWYLSKIYAKEAWSIRHDASKVIVAVIDSGVDLEHPDLVNNIWLNSDEMPANGVDDDGNGFIDDVHGWNFVDNSNNPRPAFKGQFTSDIIHGTVVSGIIGAEGNNMQGISGIAWKIQLMPLKVLDDSGEGSASNVQQAIDYAITNHADIINLSFVGSDYSQALYEAIRRAHDAGIIVVAAAGNNNTANTKEFSLDKKPLYPICMDGSPGENLVIGVAATDAIDQRAAFSGYGKKCIDISAPGISVFGTSVYRPDKLLNGDTMNQQYDGYWSGTSVAAPMVTGAIALIKSVNSDLNRQEVIDVLLKNTVNINKFNPDFAGQLGFGRLNIESALIDAKTRLAQTESNIVVVPSSGGSVIRTFNSNGKLLGQFMAFDKNFKGGVHVAVGDIDGDRNQEIVATPAQGGGPIVKIFDLRGNLKKSFFVYEKNYHDGVNLALVKPSHEGGLDLVVSPAGKRLPEVKIFNFRGELKSRFMAYDKKFSNGVNLAIYDIDNDEASEIVTAPITGGGSQVKFFRSNGKYVRDFWPYGKLARGGLNINVGNFSGRTYDRAKSFVVGKVGSTEITIFNRQLVAKNRLKVAQFTIDLRNQIAISDFNRDGVDELALAGKTSKGPEVRIYDYDHNIISSFIALPKNYSNLNLTYIKK